MAVRNDVCNVLLRALEGEGYSGLFPRVSPKTHRVEIHVICGVVRYLHGIDL